MNNTDRCDRCGAQAYVWVEFSTGGELLFCGHHFDAYSPNLGDNARVVEDSRKELISA